MGLFDFLKTSTKNLASRTFLINGVNITVSVEKSPSHPGHVKSSIFREIGVRGINPFQLTTENNFFNDIDLLAQGIDGKPWGNEALASSLILYCKAEYIQYKRLIDLDIEGYVDSVMHLAIAVSKGLKMSPISQNDGIQLRKAFKDLVYKNFYDYIYVNKYDGPMPTLVKLSEI